MGGYLSGRERVEDHVHGEGREKGRRKKDNNKENDTGKHKVVGFLPGRGGMGRKGSCFFFVMIICVS